MGDGIPYPDPGPLAQIFKDVCAPICPAEKQLRVDLVTIGFGPFANMDQLTAISSNCAKFASGPDDLVYYNQMILSIMCE